MLHDPSEIRSLGEMQQEPHVAVQGDRADMRPAGLVHRNDPIDASNTSAQSLTPRGAIHVISRQGRAYLNAARAAASSPLASLSTAWIQDFKPFVSRTRLRRRAPKLAHHRALCIKV